LAGIVGAILVSVTTHVLVFGRTASSSRDDWATLLASCCEAPLLRRSKSATCRCRFHGGSCDPEASATDARALERRAASSSAMANSARQFE